MIRVDLIHCLAPLLISPRAGLSSSSGVACKWESSSRVELKHDTGFVLPTRNKAMTINIQTILFQFFNSPDLLTSSLSMIFGSSPQTSSIATKLASMPLPSLGTNLLLVVWAPFQWFLEIMCRLVAVVSSNSKKYRPFATCPPPLCLRWVPANALMSIVL